MGNVSAVAKVFGPGNTSLTLLSNRWGLVSEKQAAVRCLRNCKMVFGEATRLKLFHRCFHSA